MKIFLKFYQDITGDVKAKGFEDSVQVFSYQQDFENESDLMELTGNERSARFITNSGIVVSKDLDCASAAMLKALHTGQVHKKVSLHFLKKDRSGHLTEVYAQHMTNVVLASIEQSLNIDEANIEEVVHLIFETSEHKIWELDKDGAIKQTNTFGWHYIESKPL